MLQPMRVGEGRYLIFLLLMAGFWTSFNQIFMTLPEYIRDYGLMTIFGNWSYLKNHSKRKAEWANDVIFWVSALGGKRESYRVVGDYVMTQNDIEDFVIYPDATGSITWNIDLHFPDPVHAELFDEPFDGGALRLELVPHPVEVWVGTEEVSIPDALTRICGGMGGFWGDTRLGQVQVRWAVGRE